MVRFPLFPVACFGAALASLPLSAVAGERVLTRFDGSDSLRWQTVNDGVMGGRSQGDFELTPDKTLRFSGAISLENNGGFSSIRTRSQALDVADSDGLALRVRGDGRTYKVSLRTAGTSRWIAYWAELPTTAGEWINVRIPFDAWAPTTFGRKLPGPQLDLNTINSVGFMLYDKKDGAFNLEVASIAAYSGAATQAQAPAPKGTTPNIVEAAQAAGSFKTLLAAAQAAGLAEALSGPGPFTVFAPTDDAFAALPEGTVEALLKPYNRAALQRVLKHHVISGAVTSGQALLAGSAKTLAETQLKVSYADGAFRVGNATITALDLSVSNGVIHVIDSVLLPPALELATGPAKPANPTAGAARLIERAIERGVPLFNEGQQGACSAIYEVAVMALLDLNQDLLPAKIQAQLRASLTVGSTAQNDYQGAWDMRRALDAAYRFLLKA